MESLRKLNEVVAFSGCMSFGRLQVAERCSLMPGSWVNAAVGFDKLYTRITV